MIYLRLFWEFFKTGLFSVGGGLATLPFIYDMSDRTGWFTYQQIADMVAVSESTPGPSASTRRRMWATSRAAFPARSSRRSVSSRRRSSASSLSPRA